MLKDLGSREKVIGAKQSSRAIRSGRAGEVFLASDADPVLTAPLLELCRQTHIPVTTACSMRQLGQAAGIQVGTAVVTLLRKPE